MDELMSVAEENERKFEERKLLESIPERSTLHVKTEPVVEILSIRLLNNNNSSGSKEGFWEIYGNIYVYDAVRDNRKCYIYEGNEEDDYPEKVSFQGGYLSLTGPDDVMSMDKPTIFIDLMDTISGETIISHFAPLDTTIDTAGGKQEHQFEQFKKLVVHGTSCSVEVEYLALTFGVFAHIEVQLVKSNKLEQEDQNQEQEVKAYGTICALYNLMCSENKVNNRIVLFENKEEEEDSSEFGLVDLGIPIIMSRSVVAVPGYSSITIQIELWDRATKKLIVHGSTTFESFNYDAGPQSVAGLNCLNAQVKIVWKEPFLLEFSRYSSADLRKPSVPWGLYPHFWPSRAVEVLSIFIGRQSDKPLRLHGMVLFSGMKSISPFIFKRDKDDPYILPPGCHLLPLEGPNETLLPADYFFMAVNLVDVDGHVSIKGFAKSSPGHDYRKEGWFDRLLCSVVKDEHERGFAAIHYTVFGHAGKVALKVKFFFKGDEHYSSQDDFSKIHGSLVALFGKSETRTSYEMLYYRNVLFQRLEDNPLEVPPCANFEVELSKSVFAAPLAYPFQIVADLRCFSAQFGESLKESRKVDIKNGVFDSVVIQGDKFGVVIDVQWSRA